MPPESLRTIAEDAGPPLISERFSEERETRQRLVQAIPSFQSFSPDYPDGLCALKPWQESTPGEAPAMAGAHAALLKELEQEVRQYLENEAAFCTGPR